MRRRVLSVLTLKNVDLLYCCLLPRMFSTFVPNEAYNSTKYCGFKPRENGIKGGRIRTEGFILNKSHNRRTNVEIALIIEFE